MHGFQLWANLPAALKMTAPRYQDIKASEIPQATDDDGTRVRIICGTFMGQKGPVEGVAADPRYLDISLPPQTTRRFPVEASRHGFAYVFAGSGTFGEVPTRVANRSLVLFDRGDDVSVSSGPQGIRFLLVSGNPLNEPVAWGGPIVMNTEQQLRQAFDELERGTFIK
jgi:redox-sensitive bicupin YhaK (pirin superfamily)